MPKRYDHELGTVWHAVFSRAEKVAAGTESSVESLATAEEITPEKAEEAARIYGFDTFEIVRTETEITRYTVDGGEAEDE